MLAWGGSEPINCLQDKNDAQKAFDLQKSKEDKYFTEDQPHNKNETGVLFHDSTKATSPTLDAGRNQTPTKTI
ncbi:hypothetical protein [Brevibacillus laterosporus]|uniref:hypothetical protein n=1 Tax=Brevibacillus laterosporus TaxID=1465 RepID=UPI0013C4988A|nr:hypothetical protein [Brevibacillus laterosporus]